MFFLLRSGLCIGIVYAMLPSAGPSPSLRDIAVGAGQLAAAKAEHYCTGNDQCLRAGARVAASLLAAKVGTDAVGEADPHAGSLSEFLASDLVPRAPKPRPAPKHADLRTSHIGGPV